MKLVFVILTSALHICFTLFTSAVSRSSTFHKREKELKDPAKRLCERSIHESSSSFDQTRKKLRTGTRSFEDEEKMRKSYSEMGKKGGLATSEAYLRKANGNPRIAKKLRSKAAKDGMKARQEKHSQQIGKQRYENSNNAFMARFQASEMKAKEKGFSPKVERREDVKVAST